MYLFDRSIRISPFILNAKSNSLLCYLPQRNTFSSPGYVWCAFFQLKVFLFIFVMKIPTVIQPKTYCPDVYLLGCPTQYASYVNTCTYIEI